MHIALGEVTCIIALLQLFFQLSKSYVLGHKACQNTRKILKIEHKKAVVLKTIKGKTVTKTCSVIVSSVTSVKIYAVAKIKTFLYHPWMRVVATFQFSSFLVIYAVFVRLTSELYLPKRQY